MLSVAMQRRLAGGNDFGQRGRASFFRSSRRRDADAERLPTGFNREEYRHTPENDFKRVSAHPLSTFSIDADTASYSNVRRFLNDDELPPDGAVRLEELINYFQFDYAQPRGDAPVGVVTEVSRCPWNEQAPARAGRRARQGFAAARAGAGSRGCRCRAISSSCSTCLDR